MYAIPESFRLVREYRPYAGCFEIIGETPEYYVLLIKVDPVDGEKVTQKVKKKYVVALSDVDISSLVSMYNEEIENMNKKLHQRIEEMDKRVKEFKE